MRARHATAVLIFAAALAAVVWLAMPASGQERAGVRWEYAELRLSGNDAYVYIAERIVFLEGPQRVTTQAVENTRKVELTPNVALVHLDRLGRDGWEVMHTDTGAATMRFFLKRAY